MITADQLIEEPGFYPDMPEETYFLDPCPTPSLRQSVIKVLDKRSAYHAAHKHPRLNPYAAARDPSKFMEFGSAVHTITLGKGKEISTIRYPDFKSSSAQRAAAAARGAGRIPILEREVERATAISKVVKAIIEEELEGAEYFTEVPFFWIEETPFGPVWGAGMLDIWCPSKLYALDLKVSVTPATPDAVGRDMAERGNDVQNVWYRRGLGKLIPAQEGRFRFGTLYAESEEPHGSSVFELDESSAHTAEGICLRALRIFGRCLQENRWPSYPRSQTTATPSYHQQAAMSRYLEEN